MLEFCGVVGVVNRWVRLVRRAFVAKQVTLEITSPLPYLAQSFALEHRPIQVAHNGSTQIGARIAQNLDYLERRCFIAPRVNKDRSAGGPLGLGRCSEDFAFRFSERPRTSNLADYSRTNASPVHPLAHISYYLDG